MKVLGIVGSPRKGGNTEILVKEALSGAAEKGAETQMLNLQTLNISGCQACSYCKTHETCAIEDDMQPIYDEILQADAMVLGTPIYMWQVTGQTKVFMDRLYALIDADFSSKLAGKDMLFIVTQGAPDQNAFKPYIEHTANMFKFGKVRLRDVVIASGLGAKGEVSERQALMTQARTAGQELVNGQRKATSDSPE